MQAVNLEGTSLCSAPVTVKSAKQLKQPPPVAPKPAIVSKLQPETRISMGKEKHQCLIFQFTEKQLSFSKDATSNTDSLALDVLLSHKHQGKELPELLPFPFKPDPAVRRPKSSGKTPKPSKFVMGKMYHSDYDSGTKYFKYSLEVTLLINL